MLKGISDTKKLIFVTNGHLLCVKKEPLEMIISKITKIEQKENDESIQNIFQLQFKLVRTEY